MKSIAFPLLASVVLSAAAHAQITLEPDATTPINDYISLGEFETAGVVEGWNSAGGGANPRLRVANGVLQVTTTAGDPWFFRAGLRDIPPDFTLVEVRIKKVAGSSAAWELFYGSSAAGGFSGARRLGYDLPNDTDYHILQFDMAEALAGASLTDLRIDAGQGAGNIADVDYVRVGKVSPDTDADGLPDSVETATGIFVNARDTGSSPSKLDSDGDGVSDGTEVRFGTDPNDKAVFPVPSIRYPVGEAVYVTTVPADANLPQVNLGNANSFAVTPALPSGLSLNPTTGLISGTPTVAAPSAEYVVTANFGGGIVASATLRIEVRSPYIEFAVDRFAFRPGIAITPIVPALRGPAPTGFQISPALPTGLTLDALTGEISGVPEEFTAARGYAVTATYNGSPSTTAELTLSVLEPPSLTVDPTEPLLGFATLGEFEEEADIALINIRNGIGSLSVSGGALQVQTTGGDPYLGRVFTPAVDYRVLEFRLKVTEGTPTPMRFYWAENADGRRSLSELTAHSISDITADGEFHVYRVDFRKSMEGSFSVLRIDPGDGAGTSMEFDYIRFGGFEPLLSVAAETDGKLRISWAAAASEAGYKLQGAATLGATWTADTSPVQTAAGTASVLVTPGGTARYFRLAK